MSATLTSKLTLAIHVAAGMAAQIRSRVRVLALK